MSLPPAKPRGDDDESLLPVLRALIACEAQVMQVSLRHIQSLGVTGSQFDVLVTLGDLPGLSCSELGERTLITRGTLFPILDRLEARGLVQRAKSATDSRQTLVSLTLEGQAFFERSFQPHVAYMKPLFDCLRPKEQDQLIRLLGKLEAHFAAEGDRTCKPNKGVLDSDA